MVRNCQPKSGEVFIISEASRVTSCLKESAEVDLETMGEILELRKRAIEFSRNF